MTRILIILSSANKLIYKDGSVKNTGWYLPEAAHPYYVFKKAGYAVDFGSLKGANPPVDQESVENYVEDKGFLEDPEVQAKLASAKKLADVKIADYDAIFYVGGHGPVADLAVDPVNGKFASEFYQSGKLTAAVCHGTAALANAKDTSGASIFASGKRFTGFSNEEETQALGVENFKKFPYLLEDELAALGGVYEHAEKAWVPHHLNDGNLYTGQNPASAKPLAEAIVAKLGYSK